MKAMSYTNARNNFASLMTDVCESHAPVIITRSKKPSVVMLSLDDYSELDATAYLLRSPKNAQRLLEAIEDFKHKRNFIEVDIE